MGHFLQLSILDQGPGSKDRYKQMRDYLESHKKDDPILEQICDGKMTMKSAVHSIEKKFKGLKKYKFKMKLDSEYNGLVNYVRDSLDLESDILQTGKCHYGKKVDAGRIMSAMGATWFGFLSIACPPAAICAGPITALALKQTFDPELLLAKQRKSVLKLMKDRADSVDKMIEAVYERTEEQIKKKEEKKYSAYKDKDLGDIVGK